jgi:hypothetical protein
MQTTEQVYQQQSEIRVVLWSVLLISNLVALLNPQIQTPVQYFLTLTHLHFWFPDKCASEIVIIQPTNHSEVIGSFPNRLKRYTQNLGELSISNVLWIDKQPRQIPVRLISEEESFALECCT